MAEFMSVHGRLVLVMEPAVKGETKGRRIEFQQGRYITDDPEEIEFIRNHPGFGRYITEISMED